MNFSPPTATHLIVFSVLLLGGILDLVSYEMFHTEVFSLTAFLTNGVSILLLSAGWSVPIAEGAMFFERAIEERRKRIQEQEQEAVAQNLVKFLETRPLTKDDLPRLRQIFSTGSDT